MRFSIRRQFFTGYPEGAEALHVLANSDILLFDISHGPNAFFPGQPLPLLARHAFRRWLNQFFSDHLCFSEPETIKPAQSID